MALDAPRRTGVDRRAPAPAPSAVPGRRLPPRPAALVRRTVREVLPLAVALSFVFPFLVMVVTSLKGADEILTLPPTLLPEHWELGNYGTVSARIPFFRYLANTLLLAVATVVGALLANPLIAYSLSKIPWRGRKAMLLLVLATMMLPPQVTMIPVFLMWSELGLTNSYWPLIVPAFLGGPFYVFLLRQFFMGIPDDLLDAARIDGASELRIFLYVVLPLAKPALATVAVFQFVATWTDFLYPLIYLNDERLYTLSIGLFDFFTSRGVDWGPLMAACVLFTIPTVVIFAVGQRYFTEGIATKGFK